MKRTKNIWIIVGIIVVLYIMSSAKKEGVEWFVYSKTAGGGCGLSVTATLSVPNARNTLCSDITYEGDTPVCWVPNGTTLHYICAGENSKAYWLNGVKIAANLADWNCDVDGCDNGVNNDNVKLFRDYPDGISFACHASETAYQISNNCYAWAAVAAQLKDTDDKSMIIRVNHEVKWLNLRCDVANPALVIGDYSDAKGNIKENVVKENCSIDFCSDDKTQLSTDGICSAGECVYNTIACPNGCVSGQCVEEVVSYESLLYADYLYFNGHISLSKYIEIANNWVISP